MEFKDCKNCEHLHQMISGDRVKNVCLRTGSIEQQSIPIEAVCHCPGFKDFGVSLWEVRDVGDCMNRQLDVMQEYVNILTTRIVHGTTKEKAKRNE